MYRNLIKNTTIALGALLMSSSLVFAAGLPGSVTALDGKGMGTVRTSDGKDHQVKVGQDFKVGSKVDCEMKNSALECRLGAGQSAAQPAPATPAAAATAKTPAPAAQAAPAPTSSMAPNTSTPAPASK